MEFTLALTEAGAAMTAGRAETVVDIDPPQDSLYRTWTVLRLER